jgi:hypothetical protein
VGRKPTSAGTLQNFPVCDQEVRKLGDELWPGKVVSGKSAREVLQSAGVEQDFEFAGANTDAVVNYIHRRDGDTEIYFVANRGTKEEDLNLTFRVKGKAPELWDAIDGSHRFAEAYSQADGRTSLPVTLAPDGSIFVLFRTPAVDHPAISKTNSPTMRQVGELASPWTVTFDSRWGGPKEVTFDQLVSWSKRGEDGVRYYSGTATYSQTFDAPSLTNGSRVYLDLGDVRELAEVRLNGCPLGTVWARPFRLDITDSLNPTGNQLMIDVVNFWTNRIIGDQALPAEKQFTKTNIRKLTSKTPLEDSGLLGPVRLLASDPIVPAKPQHQ